MSPIYENNPVRVEAEPSEFPWLKIFTQHPRLKPFVRF